MASTVALTQFHRAPFECGGKGDSNPGCKATKSQRIVWCHNNSMTTDYERVLIEHCHA